MLDRINITMDGNEKVATYYNSGMGTGTCGSSVVGLRRSRSREMLTIVLVSKYTHLQGCDRNLTLKDNLLYIYTPDLFVIVTLFISL